MDGLVKEFKGFPKISRLNREVIITEKIDGSNACVVINEDGLIYAQSRKRVITADEDNFGFARWVENNAEELILDLGPGRHYGEWWGAGIQRKYGLRERRFSLFNVNRWTGDGGDGYRCEQAPLCHVVPIIAVLPTFDTPAIDEHVSLLRAGGSLASPGAQAEGIIIYHISSGTLFKVTCWDDDEPKGARNF